MNANKLICPHCTNSDPSMLELIWKTIDKLHYICSVCSKSFTIKK